MKLFFLLFTLSVSMAALATELQPMVRKLEAHFLIHDYRGARELAERLIQSTTHKEQIYPYLIKSLAKTHDEKQMWATWKCFRAQFPEKAIERSILEEMSWGIIEKSASADSMSIHLMGLLGAGLTQDIRAVPILRQNLQHSNAIFRSISVELSGHYRDAILCDDIVDLLKNERVYEVRLEILEALKTLQIDSMEPEFLKLLTSSTISSEEKSIAIQAIATLRKERVAKGEELSKQELEWLIQSPWSALRILAAECISLLSSANHLDLLEALLQDSNPEVIAHALKAIGMKSRDELQKVASSKYLLACAQSKDPLIGIAAAWVLMRVNPLLSEKIYLSLLNHSKSEIRALAASSLACSGKEGLKLCYETLKNHPDPYVRANVCYGLIGGQYHLEEASEELFQFLTTSKDQWMKQKALGSLFEPLMKSRLKHKSAVPNYPEVMNQSIRLEMLNLLAIVNHPQALNAMKSFLKERTWGVSAIAAESLLGVGDEEALDLIRECLNEKDPMIKLQAALVLAVWGKDFSAVPTLIESYAKSDRAMKIKILESLSKVGDPKAIPFLIEEMQTSSQTLRTLAAFTLIQTLNHGSS